MVPASCVVRVLNRAARLAQRLHVHLSCPHRESTQSGWGAGQGLTLVNGPSHQRSPFHGNLKCPPPCKQLWSLLRLLTPLGFWHLEGCLYCFPEPTKPRGLLYSLLNNFLLQTPLLLLRGQHLPGAASVCSHLPLPPHPEGQGPLLSDSALTGS